MTLIELLVVIAIIAMLVALLIPGLKHALEMARRAVCTSIHERSFVKLNVGKGSTELILK